MSIDIECIVVGAGVVGLAIARELALSGTEVLVLEAEEAIGMGTSSRNSEVIHAGIYYAKDSLKARLCVEGKQRLYAYCEERHIPYKKLGKLLVATTEEQIPNLQKIAAQGKANGVDDLQWLDASETKQREPELNCVAAVLSPSTGIIDSHAYMLALQGDAENAGAQVILRTPMLRASRDADGAFTCEFGGDEPMTLRCRQLINASGLHAPALARRISGLDARHIPDEYYCKGSYFTLNRRAPFSHLIYPMPNEAGLGVHLTLDMGGQAKFGPDTEWIEQENYLVDPAHVTAFDQAIRSWWPELPDNALEPGYAGIRPKIVPPTSSAGDFVISRPADHGVSGLVNLFGIESPGLTAAMAIAAATARSLSQS